MPCKQSFEQLQYGLSALSSQAHACACEAMLLFLPAGSASSSVASTDETYTHPKWCKQRMDFACMSANAREAETCEAPLLPTSSRAVDPRACIQLAFHHHSCKVRPWDRQRLAFLPPQLFPHLERTASQTSSYIGHSVGRSERHPCRCSSSTRRAASAVDPVVHLPEPFLCFACRRVPVVCLESVLH